MLYNCGRIFFILSFFVGYILSFGMVRLRTIRFCAHAWTHIECSSRLRVEDVTITNVLIKTPDSKWNCGVNDVMPGSKGLGILVTFEKSSLLRIEPDARIMQDAPKAVWSIPYVSVAFFPSLKQNFIAYRSSKVSWHPDCKSEASWDLSLGEASWNLDLGEASPVVVYGMRRAFVGSVSWDSDSGLRVQLGVDWRAM